MARLIALAFFAISVAIVSTSRPEVAAAAPSCSVVGTMLEPCEPYVIDQGSQPSSACCNGVKEVSDSAASKADLEAVCNCIKNALPSIENASPARISGLPKACGVNSNFAPVDPNYDCSKISD
ncbi:non-specific lipid-transfer protein 3-like [Coffea eugenioides]|uniref:non-specific lipid-transfer protein 3-like n=1 Tax=Coffea eugenioides TaxID=49369 RepID=UPI000F612EC8|nr:non-specific lipid-transfer protein 3-like [Coffea eugenioides]